VWPHLFCRSRTVDPEGKSKILSPFTLLSLDCKEDDRASIVLIAMKSISLSGSRVRHSLEGFLKKK
jgi:hypothetical protein